MNFLVLETMIDYLTVIYRNYDLLDLQIENFKKRFSGKDYRLIVVDNTPNSEKKEIKHKDDIDLIVELESVPTFDGISHGQAIDTGLKYCESPIVCIFDTDFFFLNENVHEYALEKFSLGYKAVGTSWDDGDGAKILVKKFPQNFENIPCCFGSFYDLELAKSNSWIVTLPEIHKNAEVNGFVEVGWKIREHILKNNLKTLSWETDSDHYGDCFFKNELGKVMGIHYVGGSHRRWTENTYNELKLIIDGDY